jgi:hypothetical protein
MLRYGYFKDFSSYPPHLLSCFTPHFPALPGFYLVDLLAAMYKALVAVYNEK